MATYRGHAHKYGDHVDTDVIIPARYLNTSSTEELAAHCMEDIDSEFLTRMRPGDIIVGGRNFGCGSSREHAPVAIKGAGIACVIADSFARIFYRNSINTGLPVFECPEAAADISAGDEVEVCPESGEIRNLTTGKVFQTKPFPGTISDIISAGGLSAYVKQKIESK